MINPVHIEGSGAVKRRLMQPNTIELAKRKMNGFENTFTESILTVNFKFVAFIKTKLGIKSA